MFLDNVTTILLMTPITVKLFECLGLNPVPVLPFIILNINIAGLTTLIGHPPNLLITGNSYIAKQNITFLEFTMHMSFGVLIALIQTNCHLRVQHRDIYKILAADKKDDDDVKVWQKCLDSMKTHVNGDKLDGLKMILLHKIETIEAKNASTAAFGTMEGNEKSFDTTLRQLKKLVSEKSAEQWEFSIFAEEIFKIFDKII